MATIGGMDKLLSNGISTLSLDPFILPPDQRPDFSDISSDEIPVIDLSHTKILQQISNACKEYGFFQIVNHGVPNDVIESMFDVAKEFFEMPVEERAKLYSEDPKKEVRVSTSFNIREEEVLHWRDFLRHPCHPLEDFINSWPEKPQKYREVASRYVVEIRSLILNLMALLSEALGLDPGYLNEKFGKHKHIMLINYYPPCPDPNLTLGVPCHSDFDGFTILLQDETGGLQVLKDGKWIAVKPMRNALVFNVADQLQVISNGRFKSVKHRVVTNSTAARISIPTFYGPSSDTLIGPADALVNKENPAIYKSYIFAEFFDAFWSKDAKKKSALDDFILRP
ncbi:protein DMR6-LIKE OXYGENASE 1-like isoform X1 [Amborella trichopoda]|uniref:protein DMR6-LIKE OXYGENASE 1-like isoform X1 n=1 Tax=Amborella trichopoda TaxID=13333 RepID=UPI0005D465BE|nr:protein DMR6-LIKE OXYGENASE 1-like isoform X1 [Amborella trichopoda]|eukprot:XP_011620893.1 protein DMR6-LIKE OXYGENASE 1-like isoform X1 [Amborella trichopoda]